MPDKAHTPEEHAEKMCALTCCPHGLPLEKIKLLTKDPKFICASCGRVVTDKKDLCMPEPVA